MYPRSSEVKRFRGHHPYTLFVEEADRGDVQIIRATPGAGNEYKFRLFAADRVEAAQAVAGDDYVVVSREKIDALTKAAAEVIVP